MNSTAPHSAHCNCERLRLDGAELADGRIDWAFRFIDPARDDVIYVRASTPDLPGGPLSRVFYTSVSGLAVDELGGVEAGDFSVGLPDGLSRDELEDRIGEELARQYLTLQFTLDTIDRREEASGARPYRSRPRRAA